MIRKIRFPVYFLEGKECVSGKDLSLAYIGRGAEKTYLATLAFCGEYRETLTGNIWIWNLGRWMRRQSADMVIVANVGPRLYRMLSGGGGFYVPNWVRGEIVFEDASEKMKTSGHVKSDLRRIRKNEFDFEVTQSTSRFDEFYHTMYVPHVAKQFGRLAQPMEYGRMKSLEDSSELLLVTKQGQALAGQILVYEGDRVRCWSIGVKDGNHDYVRMGAQAALYYFEIQYLSERGYQAMHVGASRPFLRDGVLRFKNKWGMRLLGTSREGFMLKPLRKSAGVLNFLANNPFISQLDGKSVGNIFTGCSPLSVEGQNICAQYSSADLSDLRIYTEKGQNISGFSSRLKGKSLAFVSTETLF